MLYHKPMVNKNLLTANLNLVDVVNTGGNLFFDCPPIVYDERKKQVQEYYTCVDAFSKPCTPNSPKIVSQTLTHADRSGKIHTQSKLVEVSVPN